MQTSTQHTSSNPHLVLLAGAGLPPSTWDPLRHLLRVGSTALPSAHPVERALEQLPGGVPLVLVMHSGAGVWGQQLAAHVAHRVVGLVAVAALVPPAGGGFLDCLPWPQRVLLRTVMTLLGTRPPDGVLRAELGAGLEERQVRQLVSTFTPEPRSYYFQRVSASPWPNVPSLYVHTTMDRSVTLAMQRAFASRLPRVTPATLDTGHLPMLQNPSALAAVLHDFLQTRALSLAVESRH